MVRCAVVRRAGETNGGQGPAAIEMKVITHRSLNPTAYPLVNGGRSGALLVSLGPSCCIFSRTVQAHCYRGFCRTLLDILVRTLDAVPLSLPSALSERRHPCQRVQQPAKSSPEGSARGSHQQQHGAQPPSAAGQPILPIPGTARSAEQQHRAVVASHCTIAFEPKGGGAD